MYQNKGDLAPDLKAGGHTNPHFTHHPLTIFSCQRLDRIDLLL